MYDRKAGALLHITSLPGPFGIGDLGPEAFRFADFLAEAGQSLWQILPVGPLGYGYSPYQSPSTFAGNELLISPEMLLKDGLASEEDLSAAYIDSPDAVCYADVAKRKRILLTKAFDHFRNGRSGVDGSEYDYFRSISAFWLDDYSLFAAIKHAHMQRSWTEWPHALASRNPDALSGARSQLDFEIELEKFSQFVFFRQWHTLKEYCRSKGISIVGDLPIYVAHDSADVWSNPHLFHLDNHGNPTIVAGVPPDYFSKTGQRWGNPIYRWDVMRENGFSWWTERIRMILSIVDIVRLDHFRAFDAYWAVPASEETAENGEWIGGPGQFFFDVLRERLGPIPLIAEDLGLVTDGVIELINANGFPGMAILEFAFDSGPSNKFLPHNYPRNIVAYSGTHDNDTVAGWLSSNRSTQDESTVQQIREYARRYLGECRDDQMHKAFVRALYASVADTVVIPVQDFLGLGGDARMNEPGTLKGNWLWRMRRDALTTDLAVELRSLTETFGRR